MTAATVIRLAFGTPSPPPMLTPCIGVCELGSDGLCRGCFRTAAEIAAWTRLSDAEREHLMHRVLPEREASRAG